MSSVEKFLSIATLLVAACPAPIAWAVDCKDSKQEGTKGEDAGRSTDCEDLKSGVPDLRVVLSCVGRGHTNPGAFMGLTLMKATNHVSLEKKVLELKDGWVLEVNYGSEQQKWVFDDGAFEIDKNQASFTGTRKDALVTKNESTTRSLEAVDQRSKIVVRFKPGAPEQIPLRVTFGKDIFKCGSGRFNAPGAL